MIARLSLTTTDVRTLRPLACLLVLAFLCASIATLAAAEMSASAPRALSSGFSTLGPKPGDVYREYIFSASTIADWQVTDPNATAPTPRELDLPNDLLHFYVPTLEHAIRAEVMLDRWGGHPGTTAKRIRFNPGVWLPDEERAKLRPGRAPENWGKWILVPELQTTPEGEHPESFVYQDNPIVEVPLDQFRDGPNFLQADCTALGNGGWGKWGFYGVVLRIYYDPDEVPHPDARIATPANDETIEFGVEAQIENLGDRRIVRADVLAYYDGYDEDGDGVSLDYHRAYHMRDGMGQPIQIGDHVGTATWYPLAVAFNDYWIPDQEPGIVRLIARVQDEEGVWSVTDEVTGLSFKDVGYPLRLYQSHDVPPRFDVSIRSPRKSCHFYIPPEDDLANAESRSTLYIRTWNGDAGEVSINGKWTCDTVGLGHFYAYQKIFFPTDVLQQGENTIEFHSEFTHHGMEILWPGPAVLVRYHPAEDEPQGH